MKYNRLPLKFNGITEPYLSKAGPYYSKSNPHKGVDLGWNDNYGGQYNTPVYAINDGIVMFVDKTTGNNNAGNYIWIKHEFNDYALWSRYCHLKDNSTLVKPNQKVTRGQQIATMGGTFGYAVHLHFEMWKTPKNWSFNWNDRMKYLVNPTDYTFLFDDQVIGTSTNNKVITKVIGTSKQAKRDTTKNQIEVVGEFLRVRKGAGTNQTILGYIDYGIYDYTETKTANGYTWYNLGFGWIAGTKEDTKVYPKENPEDDKDKKIAELEEQVKKLDTELLAQKTLVEKQKEEIDKLHEEIENLQNSKEFVSNLTMFTADKEGYWKIYLKKDEKVYY